MESVERTEITEIVEGKKNGYGESKKLYFKIHLEMTARVETQGLSEWWIQKWEDWIDEQLKPIVIQLYPEMEVSEALNTFRDRLGESIDIYRRKYPVSMSSIESVPCLVCHKTMVKIPVNSDEYPGTGVCGKCTGVCFHCGTKPWPFFEFRMDCCERNLYCCNACRKADVDIHRIDCSFYKQLCSSRNRASIKRHKVGRTTKEKNG